MSGAKRLVPPDGYEYTDQAPRVGDLIQWDGGRVWREVVEVDDRPPYETVAKNGKWRSGDGPVRMSPGHCVIDVCRRVASPPRASG